MIISKDIPIQLLDYVVDFHHWYFFIEQAAGLAIGIVGDAGVRANA